MDFSIVSSLVVATATATGVLIALFKYISDRKRAQEIAFIEWFTSFSESFRNNSDFQEVRVLLVSEKQKLFKMFLGVWKTFNIPEKTDTNWKKDFEKDITNASVDWIILRKFTDYLHFFEEMLIIAERLTSQGQKMHAELLRNRFSWYYSVLVKGWDSDAETNKKKICFVLSYIKNGEYIRIHREIAHLIKSPIEYI
jgi:hypothetical protein